MVSDFVDRYYAYNEADEDLRAARGVSYPFDIGACRSSSVAFGGDQAAVDKLVSEIEAGEASDANIIYLYNCDSTGHIRGYSAHV